MSATVSLMALPVRSEDGKLLAQFYVLGGGTWHEVPIASAVGLGLDEVKAGVTTILGEVMTQISLGAVDNATSYLKGQCHKFWNDVLPPAIRDQLEVMTESAEPASVLVHTHPSLEWLPWELLYDGKKWLGLQCRVARLLMVPNGPANTETCRTVTEAASFLGSGVFDTPADAAQMARWSSTFTAAESRGILVRRFPVNGQDGWPKLDNVQAAESCDIIHLTCHGQVDKKGTPFLTLNPDDKLANVDETFVGMMQFPVAGPLVFGNACGSARSAAVGSPVQHSVAVAFFDRGASAFIGAIAPITKTLAVEFAEVFYRRLLIDGLAVGEALRSTKQHFEQSGTPDPSWLFYCLYGSPDTRFVPVQTS